MKSVAIKVVIKDDRGETVAAARKGDVLLDVLRKAGKPAFAACGGKGICRKCAVTIEGVGERMACGHIIERDIRVVVPGRRAAHIVDWEKGCVKTSRCGRE